MAAASSPSDSKRLGATSTLTIYAVSASLRSSDSPRVPPRTPIEELTLPPTRDLVDRYLPVRQDLGQGSPRIGGCPVIQPTHPDVPRYGARPAVHGAERCTYKSGAHIRKDARD